MNIREQYSKLKIPIIEDIHKVMKGQKKDYKQRTYKDIRDYKFCLVGTVRERLGLSNVYDFGEIYVPELGTYIENKSYCSKCKDLANGFPEPVESYPELKDTAENNEWHYKYQYEREAQEAKEKYEALLIEFKQHLILDHGVKLNGV